MNKISKPSKPYIPSKAYILTESSLGVFIKINTITIIIRKKYNSKKIFSLNFSKVALSNLAIIRFVKSSSNRLWVHTESKIYHSKEALIGELFGNGLFIFINNELTKKGWPLLIGGSAPWEQLMEEFL